jgi:hypothetical protein
MQLAVPVQRSTLLSAVYSCCACCRWLGVEKFYIMDNNSTMPAMLVLWDYISSGIVDYQYFVGGCFAAAMMQSCCCLSCLHACILYYFRSIIKYNSLLYHAASVQTSILNWRATSHYIGAVRNLLLVAHTLWHRTPVSCRKAADASNLHRHQPVSGLSRMPAAAL